MNSNSSAKQPSSNELLKLGNPSLAGAIASTLADAQADHFSEDDSQFLKFHGIYQQDDRDLRKTGKKFIMMVRVRMPGGILTPAQYLDLDTLATRYGNNTLRITSRQGIQFHSVLKSNLAQVIKGINDVLLTTIAACGDVVRNVMAPLWASGASAATRQEIFELARRISANLAPVTPAYAAIWLNGRKLDLPAGGDFEDPLYGKTYLPRKFKVGFVIPPLNDVDIFTHCIGLIAIVEHGRLAGYNLTAGGGMGRSHGNANTFPRLADVIGFLQADQVEAAVKAAVTIHRDFGDRHDRRHARLKYVLADRGAQWFREELERRAGFRIAEARPFQFTHQGDFFGWRQQEDGNLCLGLFVETGRIKDRDGWWMKTALRELVTRYQPEIRLTPGNNLLLTNIAAGQQDAVTRLLAQHGIHIENQGSPLRRASMACVSLPTCGLGLAESERYLPDLITQIEGMLTEFGLAGEEIGIRMTGCPNGCARPYVAELGFVGRAPGRYQIWIGGNEIGTRLNRLWKDNVKSEDMPAHLHPLIERFARERQPGERFGNWAERVVWKELSPPPA